MGAAEIIIRNVTEYFQPYLMEIKYRLNRIRFRKNNFSQMEYNNKNNNRFYRMGRGKKFNKRKILMILLKVLRCEL